MRPVKRMPYIPSPVVHSKYTVTLFKYIRQMMARYPLNKQKSSTKFKTYEIMFTESHACTFLPYLISLGCVGFS